MKTILVLHLGAGDETETVSFLGQQVQIHRIGCGGDGERAHALVEAYDGRVEAIALEGMPSELRLGAANRTYTPGAALAAAFAPLTAASTT